MYTDPIEEILFSDIKSFVDERNRESIILDYKQSVPGDLAKVMAAMANTQGGVILIGVSEKNNSGHPDKIVGVDVADGEDRLRQKIVSIAYKGIYPPLTPEIAICRIEEEPNKGVAVVRIIQSDQAPHAVDQRRKIYVRVDSQSEPQTLANIQELEWLWDKRRKAEERSHAIVLAAQKRSDWATYFNRSEAQRKSPLYLRIWLSPLFLSEANVFDGRNIIEVFAVSSAGHAESKFPADNLKIRSIPAGCCAYADPQRRENYEYIEVNSNGLMYADNIFKSNDGSTGQSSLVYYRLLNRMKLWFEFVSNVVKMSEIGGLIKISASLHNAQGVLLDTAEILRQTTVSDPLLYRSMDESIIVLEEIIPVWELENKVEDFTKQAIRNTLWAFGIAWNLESFEQWWSGLALGD